MGMLGAGTVAGFQAPGLGRIPGVELAGCFDPEEERARKLTEKYGGEVYESGEALIKDKSLDAVLVMSPTPTHHDYVLGALGAGKHVFCEKPIALTVKEAEEMIAAGKKSKRVFMVGMVLRFFHEFEKAHRIIAGGDLGRIVMIRTTRAAGFPRGWDDWYADESRSGGVLVDMIAHDFDFLRWTIGEVDKVFTRTAPRARGELFEYALTVLQFKNGALGHVEASWAHPAGTFFTRLEAAGSEGLLSFDSREAAPMKLTRRAEEGKAAGVAVPESPVNESPYQREMAHFVELIREGVEPAMKPEDALEALRISLAARKSIAEGAPIRPADMG